MEENFYVVCFLFLGESTLVSTNNIIPDAQYYESKITHYIITEGPKFGSLLLNKRSKVERFSTEQLSNKEIYYQHSGKINSSDSLKLVAITANKESSPFKLDFDINLSEADGPLLVKKENISCSKYGRVTITREHLSKIIFK